MLTKEDQKEQEKQHKILCMHLKNALTTPSGAILRQWLRENCFMDAPMTLEAIDSPAFNQRVNARRDLYIALDNLLQEGMSYVADTE